MLGRASGLTDEQMSHLLDDPFPEGMFTPAEQAIIVFARTSTWFQPITDEIWANLSKHFSTRQIMDISLTVGLDQMVSRFHATVRTDVDGATTDQLAGSCPVPLPPMPPTD
ncbi:MAG: carboxymuconolactone decarboxylase family protein [Pseudonocardia sp.]|jgi:alkylhydroperoxidase family enzyme